MTQIVDFGRPKLNGIAPGLVAGQLLGASQLSELFLRRVSPALVDGKAELDEIRGKSIVWNQLADAANNTTNVGVEFNGITVDYDTTTGKYRVHGTATADYDKGLITVKNTTGHKYYLNAVGLPTGTGNVRGYIDGGGNVIYNGTINTSARTSDTNSFFVLVREGETVDLYFTVNAHDITLLDLGDLTVEQFDALYPDTYYPYNPGVIKNNDAAALVSESEDQEKQGTLRLGLNALHVPSHNIWDEEWFKGTINRVTGEDAEGDYLSSKNLIAVTPGKTYYFRRPTSQLFYLYPYDASGAFLPDEWGSGGSAGYLTLAGSDLEVTIPEDVHFIRFTAASNYGTTYQDDICINLSDAAFNGLYEPYGEDGVRTVNGLDGVGTAYDSAKGYKLIKSMWEVDLESLNWTLSGDVWNTTSIVFPGTGAADKATILAEKYENVVASPVNMAVAGRIGGNQWALSCNNGSTEEKPSGKMVYKLATPIEYDIIGGLPGKVFDAFAGGSEFIVSPEDAETPSAPFIGEFSYPESAVRGIITEEVFKEFLDALGTAMSGTWTMTYDASTKTYSFSFTS